MEELFVKNMNEMKEPNINFPLGVRTNNETDDKDKISQGRTTALPSSMKSDESFSSSDCLNINLISKNLFKLNHKNLQILTKYKEIYVPKIFLFDYNDISKYPPKISGVEEKSLQSNSNFNFPFFTSNLNNSNKDYLNYGYNFEQWKEYAEKIRKKFDELNDFVLEGKIKLPEPDNELEYLFALPSDYGGLGNIYNDNKYENLKLYDPKLPENKDKSFMKKVKIERKDVWFPLYPNPESLIKKSFPFPIFTFNKSLQDKQTKEKIDSNKESNDNTEDIINASENTENKQEQNENKINEIEDMRETRNGYNQNDKEEKSKSKESSRRRKRSRSSSRSNSYNRKYKKNKYYDGYKNYRDSNKYNYRYNYRYNERYYRNNINDYNRYKKRNYGYKGYYYNDDY
jgi:hypothetical protein